MTRLGAISSMIGDLTTAVQQLLPDTDAGEVAIAVFLQWAPGTAGVAPELHAEELARMVMWIRETEGAPE
ncbi:MAG: hypothetical protein GY835_23760 [bacterium]|nr:hypothetical protein [bacterium]